MFVMRTYKAFVGGASGLLWAAFVVALTAVAGTASASDNSTTKMPPRVAYAVGVNAYHDRDWKRAMTTLTKASKHGVLLADFYRARIFADQTTQYFDRVKAYHLYKKLAQALIDIDPDLDPRVRFAGQALTAFARYIKSGISEIRLPADPRRAVDYFNHAAAFFRDTDAEFELARMRLSGDGVAHNPRLAIHFLSRLARAGHPGAQAKLADLYWTGSHRLWQGEPQVQRDPLMAYTLISMAVQNAPYAERIWIEDTYQKIFCGTSDTIRRNSKAKVASWQKRYRSGVRLAARPASAKKRFDPRFIRTCSNGRPVPLQPLKDPDQTINPPRSPSAVPAMHGDMTGSGQSDQ